MIIKIYDMISAFVISIFLLISDAVAISIVTGIVSIITLIVQAVINRRVVTISRKQDLIQEQTNGKMEKLLEASIGQSRAEGKLETKDELIEVLKQTAPLGDTDQDKPTDVIVKKNEDKLL